MTLKSFYKSCTFHLEYLTEAFGEEYVDEEIDGTVDCKNHMAEPYQRRDPPWRQTAATFIYLVDIRDEVVLNKVQDQSG